MNAGSKQAAQWVAIGPSTWIAGKWRVYRSLLPHPVFWVSSGSGRPIRVESREDVLDMIRGERGDD